MILCTRKKLLLPLFLSIISLQVKPFSLRSLSPKNIVDSGCVKNYGSELASDWYQEKAHEMLAKMGVKDADHVIVRKLKVAPVGANALIHIDKWPALTTWTGIWVNESILEKLPEEIRIWQLAHEAAHYKLKHGLIFLMLHEFSTQIPVLSALVSVVSIHKILSFIVPRYDYLKKHETLCQTIVILMASMWYGRGAITLLKSTIEPTEYAVQKEFERQADLAAAEMFCNNGHAHIVERFIMALQKDIDSGRFALNGYNHPTLQEELQYLNEFWKSWLSKNPDYKTISDGSLKKTVSL